MSHIEALKQQARRHEQKEDWRTALDLYERAIDRLVQEDAPDIGLYNRVGDLYIRTGEYDAAVKSFQQAIELYVDSGLPNNAIAVCKKILRNVPDRAEVFLRMGQIRADQ
jgi:tetratricopeptide (TPR) repeat protein